MEAKGEKALNEIKAVLPAILPDERKRKLGTSGNKYVKELRPEYDRIFRMVLAGADPEDIEKETGYSKSWICKVWRSEVGLARIEELSRKQDIQLVRNRIKLLGGDCVDVLVDILRNKEDNIDILKLKASVAKDLLKLGGFGEAQELKFTHEHIYKVIRAAVEEVSEEMEDPNVIEGEVVDG